MKKLLFILSIISLTLLISNCNQHYGTYYQHTPVLKDQKIAIIPYDVYTSGKIDIDLSESELQALDKQEGVFFQRSMYHEMVNRIMRSRYPINIEVQHYDETNKLLESANISNTQLDSISIVELKSILNVDAILKAKIDKHVYLSDIEAQTVAVAETIIYFFTEIWAWFLPNNKSEIYASLSLLSTDDGSTLWANSLVISKDVFDSNYNVIDRINRRMVRNIPL